MANSSTVANGARLDDCHSSVFSLADLSGIKWHRYSSISPGLADDPVLAAFTKCLALDILAVWRKSSKKSPMQHGLPQEGIERELWIFWWGEEPNIDEISQQRGLNDIGRGSWDEGLTYECRTLLFKAIHNLVERCLLNENFVRIGRWFVKPLNKDNEEDISDRFSFSFSFFLHGESYVCTTIEIAKHQPLERLTYQHFQHVTSSTNNSVVLAPYGLAATLTGTAYRNPHEPTVKKLLEEWKPFYPMSTSDDFSMGDLCDDETEDDNIPVPPVVEVVIAGVQMNYPSHYILVPVEDTGLNSSMFNSFQGSNMKRSSVNDKIKPTNGRSPARMETNYDKGNLGPPSVASISDQIHGPQSVGSSLFSPASAKPSPNKNTVVPVPGYIQQQQRPPNQPLPSNIIKRICLSSNKTQSNQETNNFNSNFNSSEDINETKWEFTDSFKDIRCRQLPSRPYLPLDGRHSAKLDRQQRSRPNTPFHHRTHENEAQNIETQSNIILPPHSRPSVLINGPTEFMGTPQTFCPVKLEPTPSPSNLGDKFYQPKANYELRNQTPQPFIPPPQEQWTNLDQNNLISTNQTYEVDDVEIKRTVMNWKTYKLPITSMVDHKPKPPMLVCDNLDNRGYSFSHNNTSLSETALLYSCPTRKRLKVEETNEKSLLPCKQENPYYPHDVNAQQVTFGTVKSELAGMLVQDPYAFDDELDDATTTNGVAGLSDIILNKNHNQVIPLNRLPSSLGFEYGDGMSNEQDTVLTGRSQLEALLTQNTTSPSNKQPIHASKGSNLSNVIAAKSLKSNSDLDFSMDDLTHMFDEEEEGGAPTPPEEGEESNYKKMNHSIKTSTTHAATDLQRMFPTPPSMEQCQAFSPESRIPIPNSVVAMDDTTPIIPTNEHQVIYSSEKLETDKLLQDELPLLPTSYEMQTSACNKIKQHPTPTLYQPIKCLTTQLPLPTLSYTPAWQLPVQLPPDPSFILPTMPINEYINNAPVTPATPGVSFTPGTPSRSSVRTPASVQPTPSPVTFSVPTPRTPGRSGIRSVDPLESPASSFATPNSHLTSKGMYTDQHGNAAIFMNLLLSDSVLNLFRDRSFDQCALCVCNSNINGADIEMGCLPALADQEAQFRCNCGFSAVRNRAASVGNGLFLEDELEVVGAKFENEIIHARCRTSNYLPSDGETKRNSLGKPIDKAENVEELLQLAMEYSASPFTTLELCKDLDSNNFTAFDEDNMVVKHDICEACALALCGSLLAMEHPTKLDADSIINPIHQWKDTRSEVYEFAGGFDVYHLLVSLKPVLQDAVQRKRTSRTFGTTQHVKGPLTWREFCKEAGKNAEPQSIPSFVVGYNHDWVCISPESLRYWEKLYFEPYSSPRDVGYVVVCPDGDNLVSSAKVFFKELSSLYESSRLGKFKAINKVLKDGGILKIGKNSSKVSHLPLDDWFEQLQQTLNSTSDNLVGNENVDKLLLYARECLHSLGPLLEAEQSLEINSLHVREGRNRMQQSLNRNAPISNSINNIGRSPAQMQSNPTAVALKDTRPVYHPSYNASTACSIVVYLLDPFKNSASRGLWHCFRILQKSLPKPIRDHIIFQIVPIEHVLRVSSPNTRQSFVHVVRSLSFSTFAQCRRNLLHEVKVRSMTGFGPAASDKRYLQENNHNVLNETRLYTPPYVLSVPREGNQINCKHENPPNILFVSYCVSHDQKFVLASATDQCGELLETCCINIDVPPRRLSVSRKHRVSVRSEAIEKLWKFCVTTVSRYSTTTWRIVVGRLGRLSHGEIRDWGKHLHRRSLLSCTRRLSCKQCKLQQKSESGFIISACLTSLEPDGALMIMPGDIMIYLWWYYAIFMGIF
nr:mediator of RNA polymerase II transcription subunit 13-like [Ciona intestinalis]|eukprot:XP_009860078.1 mediator of RNA polymerase II transcription subunit 13-like [Ciona intestinalis]